MTKRNYDDLVEDMAKEFVKRVKAMEGDLVIAPPAPTVFNTKITAKDDAIVRSLVFKTAPDIIKGGELFQRDISIDVREYWFEVQFPNKFFDIQLSTLMTLDEFAIVLVKPGRAIREFIVCMSYTLNVCTKAMLVQDHMGGIPESVTSSGDKTVDKILQRIDTCITRDRTNQDEISSRQKEGAGGVKVITLSVQLKAAVSDASVMGIKAIGIIPQVCFAASEKSEYPVIEIDFRIPNIKP